MFPKRFTYPSPGFSHYWQSGVGNKLLHKLGRVPLKQEVEDYARLLMQYDSQADNIVKEVFEKKGHQTAFQMLNDILNNGIASVNDAPECIKELFLQIDVEPAWLDKNLCDAGAAFCRRTGLFGLFVLR